MIKFENIKRTDAKTYFFFSGVYREEMRFCVEQSGLKDCTILPFEKYNGKLPEGVTVKEVKMSAKNDRVSRKPYLLISHMELKELEKAYAEIQKREDSKQISLQ